MTPKEVEREAGRVADKITYEMQQQARDARLQPLINSGRCKRSFPQKRKRLCFEGCSNPLLHPLEECEYCMELPVTNRRELCCNGRKCYKCLNRGHESSDCPFPREEEVHPLISIKKVSRPQPISAGCVSAASTSTGSPVMVPAQVILDPSGDQYTVMFDTGSQITLITKDCAMRLGAKDIGESTLVIFCHFRYREWPGPSL